MVTLPRFSATRCALFGIVLSALFLVSGCGEPDRPPIVQTQVTEVSIPPAQQTCPSLPTPPDPDDPNTTQRDISIYITELVEVAEHCRYDLITVNRIIAEYNALARELNERKEAEANE